MEYFQFFHNADLSTNPVLIRLIWEYFHTIRIGKIRYLDEQGKEIVKPKFFLDRTARIYLPVKSSVDDKTFHGLEAALCVLQRYRPSTTLKELEDLVNDALRSGQAVQRTYRRIEPGSPPPQYDVHICLSSDLERRPLWTAFKADGNFVECPSVNPPPEASAKEHWAIWREDSVSPIPSESCVFMRNIGDLR